MSGSGWLRGKFKSSTKYPLVSVLTPTYNRREFIPWSRKCLESQDYPLSRIEWIILDDGTDPIEDLVKDCPCVRYYREEEKMNIGKKRNVLNSLVKGDFVIAWDDDDFYPPTRISHSVMMLLKSKNHMAGASECYMWYSDIKKIYKVGPYGKNHGTNGTMAYTGEYIKKHIYDEYVLNAEESSFTKNFGETMTQLDPKHCILITSHSKNTFDKRILRGGNKLIQPTDQTIDKWIKDPILRGFYENVWMILQHTEQLSDKTEDGGTVREVTTKSSASASATTTTETDTDAKAEASGSTSGSS
jgi:glycosyltransferase involved in cell wall biosynthesis